MTKGRKTTLEERIEIVLVLLRNGKIIKKQLKIIKFLINKYINGLRNMKMVERKPLKDKRGQNKEEEELTPEEKIKLRNAKD